MVPCGSTLLTQLKTHFYLLMNLMQHCFCSQDKVAEQIVEVAHAEDLQFSYAIDPAESSNRIFEQNLANKLVRDGIEPWCPQEMIAPHLEQRCALAGRSSLRFVPAMASIAAFRETPLDREAFVFIAKDMVAKYGKNGSTKNAFGAKASDSDDLLHDIFTALSLDGNDVLSFFELALGLADFVGGSLHDKAAMVCEFLDRDGDKQLTASDLQEYLSPLLGVMIPANAQSLKPFLLTRCVDQIFCDLESCQGHCNESRFNPGVPNSKLLCKNFQDWWMRHSVVDVICRVVDVEVYKVWLELSIRLRGLPGPAMVPDPFKTQVEEHEGMIELPCNRLEHCFKPPNFEEWYALPGDEDEERKGGIYAVCSVMTPHKRHKKEEDNSVVEHPGRPYGKPWADLLEDDVDPEDIGRSSPILNKMSAIDASEPTAATTATGTHSSAKCIPQNAKKKKHGKKAYIPDKTQVLKT